MLNKLQFSLNTLLSLIICAFTDINIWMSAVKVIVGVNVVYVVLLVGRQR